MPVTIPLKDHYHGDHWIGILKIGPIQINTGTKEVPVLIPMPSPFVSGRIQFRSLRGTLGYELSTEEDSGEDKGTIIVIDADTWEFEVPVQPLPLEVGLWEWDFETIDADGVVLTPYEGMLQVNQDKSYG